MATLASIEAAPASRDRASSVSPRAGSAPSARSVTSLEQLYIDATGDAEVVPQPAAPPLATPELGVEPPDPEAEFSETEPARATQPTSPAVTPPLPFAFTNDATSSKANVVSTNSTAPPGRTKPIVAPPTPVPPAPVIPPAAPYIDAVDGVATSNAAPPLPRSFADFRPRSQKVVLEADPMELSFDLAPSIQPLQGCLLRGKGFRVWADWRSSSNGTLRFYFQQMYRGLPLNEWSGGSGFPSDYEKAVDFDLSPYDGEPHRVLVKYDFRSIQITISNSTSLLGEYGLWRDNMTETLGPDGPELVTIDHPAVGNVAFTPGAPRPSPYIWEGVIGNTSQAPVGPTVHSPWWPISKMISCGQDVFYTAGYNEGKWDVQKFDISNPQVVLTNFSPTGHKQLGAPFPVDLSFFDPRTLAVKYNDGNVVAFDTATTATLADRLPHWDPPAVNVPTEGASAVAVHPEDESIVAVYYDPTDQVVVYTNAATTNAWGTNFVIGVAGGYRNGPGILVPTNTIDYRHAVKLSGHYFDADAVTNGPARVTNAVLCFQSDGKLWVGDALTSRMLRFDAQGLCDAWFMFVAHTYVAAVDPNDPKRVFAGYLEFEVDYTKPIASSWTLKNHWGHYRDGTELERGKSTENGLFSVVTVQAHGVPRTYALTRDPARANRKRLVELTPSGVRPTSLVDQTPLLELEPDGSTVAMSVSPTPQAGTTAHFFRDCITGWNGADPVYARERLVDVPYEDGLAPIYWNAARLRDNTLYLFYPGKNRLERDIPAVPFTGNHLGAVDATTGSWLWTGSPTKPLDGRGSFDTNCHYAGSAFTVIDDNIFFVYRGEGWRHGQANQIFHYKTDGTFVGQFGTPGFVQGTLPNAPGAAGNIGHISAVKVNGVIYLYTADEWSHGVHRWRIDPAPADPLAPSR